ncbi:MAG: trigger factor [Alphaproteobacteria bacterium]|nr:trigger factor [Alphaproteobacteria bacterium]
MQVKEIESAGLKRKYQVVVPASTIQDELETELKNAGKHVKIPGFRPGFVPMKILQQRYGKSMENDVLKNVIQRTTGQVLSDHKLRPALTPDVAVETYAEGKDLAYTISVETFPEVPEAKFESIRLARNTFEIEEKEVDEACARIAERSPAMVPAAEGTKAELGNVVEIDFKGMIDGVAFDGGTAEKFRLELGSKQFIDNFEEQLVGVKAGDERTVTVTFPSDYGSAHLAGKEAAFEVKVHTVLAKETPAIDDDFAKQRGFADLRGLREAVRNQLIKEYDQMVRSQLKKQLFDVLDETVKFDLPEGMVKMEFDNIWQRLKQAQAEGDESLSGKSDADLQEEYKAIASRRVKLGILLAEISNRNKLQVSREELGRAAMQQAGMFPGQERKVMEFYKNNPERLEDLRGPILEEKAVDFILTQVAFDDTKVSVDELKDASEEDDDAPKKTTKAKAKKAKKD